MDMGCVDPGFCYALGLPLVEVFSVSITKTVNDDRRCEVYGTIQFTDSRGTDVLYNRELQNSESVNSNKTLSLTSPPRCISALRDFIISLNIMDRNQDVEKCSEKDHYEVSNGRIYWSWNRMMEKYYDKFLSINVPGRDGFATVHFAALRSAIRAEVRIWFEPDEKQEQVDFYGTIVAYYGRPFDCSSSDNKKLFRLTLFNRSSGSPSKLEYGKPLPLLRPVLAVPTCSSLVIEAHLLSGDSKVEILKGVTTELLAKQNYQTCMRGDGFIAQLIVQWRPPQKEEDMQ